VYNRSTEEIPIGSHCASTSWAIYLQKLGNFYIFYTLYIYHPGDSPQIFKNLKLGGIDSTMDAGKYPLSISIYTFEVFCITLFAKNINLQKNRFFLDF
jgi:hypothetical protein